MSILITAPQATLSLTQPYILCKCRSTYHHKRFLVLQWFDMYGKRLKIKTNKKLKILQNSTHNRINFIGAVCTPENLLNCIAQPKPYLGRAEHHPHSTSQGL